MSIREEGVIIGIRVEDVVGSDDVELGFDPTVESGLLSANASFTLNVSLAVTFLYAHPGIAVKIGISFGYLRTKLEVSANCS